MSSLAASRADGYYYPPEWDPSKGSLNKVGSSCIRISSCLALKLVAPSQVLCFPPCETAAPC